MSGTRLKLPSGFTVTVRMLGPYALDPLADMFKDPGPVKRKVTLLAGDIEYWPYTFPEKVPDKDNDPEEYELYMRYINRNMERQELREKFARARRDFLLLNCVTVDDGPISIEDDGWLDDLLAAGIPAPESDGERKLLFLKTQVIRTTAGYEDIIRNALAQEVSMEDVLHAMDNLGVEWDGMSMREASKLLTNGRSKHSTRVWEIRAADAAGMGLEEWYSLPLYERALRVASSLAPEWLSALEAKRIKDSNNAR